MSNYRKGDFALQMFRRTTVEESDIYIDGCLTRSLHYNNILPAHLGIGTHSLTFSIPPTHPTSLSKPIPNPACGAPPNLLKSAYHPYSSLPIPNPRVFNDSSNNPSLSSRKEPPTSSPTCGIRRSKHATVVRSELSRM